MRFAILTTGLILNVIVTFLGVSHYAVGQCGCSECCWYATFLSSGENCPFAIGNEFSPASAIDCRRSQASCFPGPAHGGLGIVTITVYDQCNDQCCDQGCDAQLQEASDCKDPGVQVQAQRMICINEA